MENQKNKGWGLPSVLTVIFVIAKITGFIDWSWWLVFLPVLVTLGISLVILIIVLIVAAISD